MTKNEIREKKFKHHCSDCSHEGKTLAPWKESDDKPRQRIRRQRHHCVDKGSYSQSYGFSSSHVWMWDLDHKEGWALKNWCFQTVVLEKTLESPLESKEIKPIKPKGNQPWMFIGKTVTEAPVLWHLMRRADLLEKTLMLGKMEGIRRRGQQRMRWLDNITDSMDMDLGDSEGQESLACCSPWDRKELDMT